MPISGEFVTKSMARKGDLLPTEHRRYGRVLKWTESLHPRQQGGEHSGEFIHAGHGAGQAGHTDSEGTTFIPTPFAYQSADKAHLAADRATYDDLKEHLNDLNDEMLPHIAGSSQGSAEGQAKLQEIADTIKQIHRLRVDPGGIEGIGLPGPPRDLLIIGAGPGGLAAATAGGTEGLDTLLVEASQDIGGAAKYSSRIENVAGFPGGVKGADLAARVHKAALATGAEELLGVSVVSLAHDPRTDLKTVVFSNGQIETARVVVLATGTQVTVLTSKQVPGIDSPNVVYNAQVLTDKGDDGHVVVLGGANSAAQAALGAAQKAKSVTILARSGIGKMSLPQQSRITSHKKITVVEDSIVSLDTDANGHQTVVTKNGGHYPANVVGVFLGGPPATDWLPDDIATAPAEGSTKDKPSKYRGKVITNREFETSMPGVYAVGDVRHGGRGGITSATGEGNVAARNAWDFFKRVQDQAKAVTPHAS